MTTFRTTEAYISGGICGSMWWPAGLMAGKPVHAHLRGAFGLMDRFSEPASFRDACDSLLMQEGGDFSRASFTADTRIVVIRKRKDGNGRYTVHVWERELAQLADCADLVNADAYTGDFLA